MTKPFKSKVEIITPDKVKEVRQKFEDSALWVWRNSKVIVPKMQLDFKVHFQEIYASTVGKVWIYTPFWRGEDFAKVILLHEELHSAIWPIDLYRGLRTIFLARRKLAEEVNFKPKVIKEDLFERVEDWSQFEYKIEEFSFVNNILADYFVNLHIHDHFPELWETLWNFLYFDGTFYEQQKALKRDTTFILYLSVYPELLKELSPIKLRDTQTKRDKEKIVKILSEMKDRKVSKAFSLKELVKIFHPYLQKDLEDEMKGSSGSGDPRCPRCKNDTFEITAYQDPKTGKWCEVND